MDDYKSASESYKQNRILEAIRVFKDVAKNCDDFKRSIKLELLDIFMKNISHNNDRVQVYAIWGIGNLSGVRDGIPESTLPHVKQTIYKLTDSPIESTQSCAYWCISSFCENNIFNDSEVEILIEFLMIRREMHLKSLSNIVGCIAGLVKHKRISLKRNEDIFSIIFEYCSHDNREVRGNATVTLGRFIGICRSQAANPLDEEDDKNLKMNFPNDRINEVVNLLFRSTNDFNAIVARNSFYAISQLIVKGLFPLQYLDQLKSIITQKVDDSREFVRSFSISCIAYLAKVKLLSSSDDRNAMLNILIAKQTDLYPDAQANALMSLTYFAESKLLTPEQSLEIVSTILNQCNIANDIVQPRAYTTLMTIAKYYNLSEYVNEIIDQCLIGSCSTIADSRGPAIQVIDQLGIQRLIPESKMKIILSLLISKAIEHQNSERYRAISCLNILTVRNIVPSYDAKMAVLDMIGRSDDYDGCRSDALYALANMVESDLIPVGYRDKILLFLLEQSKDYNGECAACALAGVASFAEIDIIPRHRYQDVLQQMIEMNDHINEDARNNVIATLAGLIIHHHVPSSMYLSLWELFIRRFHDRYEGVRAWSTIGISKLYPLIKSSIKLPNADFFNDCVDLLLKLINSKTRKYRALEGLCFMIEQSLVASSYQNEVNQLLSSIYENSEEFFRNAPSPARRSVIYDILKRTYHSINGIQV